MDISGLYWRKSALVASQCPAGLLALRDGRLSFTTAQAKVFDAPAQEIGGHLTGWGSLVVTVGDEKYVFQTNLGQLSPPFSSTQQHALTVAKRSSSLRAIKDWPALLVAAGANFAAPRLVYRPWLLGGILIAVAAAALALRGGF